MTEYRNEHGTGKINLYIILKLKMQNTFFNTIQLKVFL
jgi:hypothetical protein